MDRLRRNKICIWLIVIGLANFAVYTAVYFCIGGDARNGYHEIVDGRSEWHLGGPDYVGHQRPGRQVSAGVWIYSYLHSISILPSMAAVLASMLVLARPHIIATMKGTAISGKTFVNGAIVLVLVVPGAIVLVFTWHFVAELSK